MLSQEVPEDKERDPYCTQIAIKKDHEIPLSQQSSIKERDSTTSSHRQKDKVARHLCDVCCEPQD